MVDLVTGASGFLGNVLVRELLNRNHEVCVFLRKTSDITPIKDLPVTKFYGDVGVASLLFVTASAVILNSHWRR